MGWRLGGLRITRTLAPYANCMVGSGGRASCNAFTSCSRHTKGDRKPRIKAGLKRLSVGCSVGPPLAKEERETQVWDDDTMIPNQKQFNEANSNKKSGLRGGPSLDLGLVDPDLLIQQTTVRRRLPGVPRPSPPLLPELLAAGATTRNHTRQQEIENHNLMLPTARPGEVSMNYQQTSQITDLL